MKKFIFFLVVTFSLSNCRKDSEDIITTKVIKGTVYNTCTDSGFAGAKLLLQTFRNESELVHSREGISDVNGNFEFLDFPIHSSNKYTYAVHIKSQSGDGAPFASLSRFTGTTMYFHNYESDVHLKPKVTPGFYLLNVYYITTPTSKNDSVKGEFIQSTFHKNVPDIPYKLLVGAYGHVAEQVDNYGGYPMGLYNITINKYKGGVHTIIHDSIYLGWADTRTYTINF